MRKSAYLTLLAALLSPTAMATLINIDFGDRYVTPDSSYGAAAGQQGIWNNVSVFGPVALADTSGTFVPGLSVDLANNIYCAGSGCGFASRDDLSEVLLKDYFYASVALGGDPLWSLQISGLTDGLYDVFYYAPSNPGVSTWPFTINGVEQASVSGVQNNTNGLTIGLTHGVATGISVSGGTMNFLSTSNDFNAGLAGLQLVGRAAVPTPASLALFGLGLAGLGWSRRKKA